MNTSLRQILGSASMLGAGMAFAGHGDADTGYYAYESIARGPGRGRVYFSARQWPA